MDNKFVDALIDFLSLRSDEARKLNKKVGRLYHGFAAHLLLTSFFLLVLLVLSFFFAPLMIKSENPLMLGWAYILYVGAGLTQLCHQLPYRSIMMSGIQQPVCARDIGIYLGALAGIATLFMKKPLKIFFEKKILLLALLPISLDGVSQTILSLRESNNVLRLITGFIFSFGVFAYVFHKMMYQRFRDCRGSKKLSGFFAVDFLLAIIGLYLLLAAFAAPLGEYIPDSSNLRLQALTVMDAQYVFTTFIPPQTPSSLHVDPFFERHDSDLVLSDIYSMRLFKPPYLVEYRGLNVTDYGSLTYEEIKPTVLGHRFGLWVVALSQTPFERHTTYISQMDGRIMIFDAVDGSLLAEFNHTAG